MFKKEILKKLTSRYKVILVIASIFLVLAAIFKNLYFGSAFGGIGVSILAALMYDVIKEEVKH